MQVTNGDIWQAKTALQELIKEPLPVKTAYWIARLTRKVNEHLRDIEMVRIKLVQQYGSPDDKGAISVAPGAAQWSEFETAFNELMSERVDFEGLPMERIQLPSSNGLCVSAATLLQLDAFVEVE